jgi:F-type H+-transporting ATPase subunit delta
MRRCPDNVLKRRHVADSDLFIPGLAGRYAMALFELARDNNAIDAVKGDLELFELLIDSSPDLNRLVRSPVFTGEEQLRALSAVLSQAGIDGLAVNFLKLVASNRRLFAVRAMIRDFRTLVARHKGEVTAEVTLAEKLSDDHQKSLKAALNAVTGKDVQVAVTVDPAIIGGVVVKLGSRMLDSSLRTKLNSIKQAMKEVG